MSGDEIIMQTYPLRDFRAEKRLSLLGLQSPPCVIPARCTRAPRDVQIMRHVTAFLRKELGLVLQVSSIGARSSVSWPENSLTHTHGLLWVTGDRFDYIKITVANAAFACCGEAAVRAVAPILEANGRILYCFRALGGIYQHAGEHQSGDCCERGRQMTLPLQSPNSEDAFHALASSESGVFIVRLVSETTVKQGRPEQNKLAFSYTVYGKTFVTGSFFITDDS